jgi:hypothetical protein
MSKDTNAEGFLVLENLSSEERLELIHSIRSYLQEARSIWERDFETEHLDISDLDELDPSYLEMMSRVEAAEDGFIWTQINDTWHDFTQAIYPLENLGPIWLSGEMIVPGFESTAGGIRSEIVGYHLARNPRQNIAGTDFLNFMSKNVPASDLENYRSRAPYVWVWAEFDCPFCEQDLDCTGDEDFTSGSIEHSGGSITFAN